MNTICKHCGWSFADGSNSICEDCDTAVTTAWEQTLPILSKIKIDVHKLTSLFQ